MFSVFLRVSNEHLTVNNGYSYVLVNALTVSFSQCARRVTDLKEEMLSLF